MDGLRTTRGGGDGPALLLLHGLGGSAEVWRPLAARWPGPWTAVDLPGHGGSPPLDRYTYGALAAAVAAELDPHEPVAVLGHSLGGVVALALASGWFGVRVAATCALGVKVSWSRADVFAGEANADRPVKTYPTADEAAVRAAKVAGLPPMDGAAARDARLVAPAGDGWRIAVDPRAFAVGRPDLPGLLAAARGPVLFAAGEHDRLCPPEHLDVLTRDARVIPGAGHSPHVEFPEQLEPVLEDLREGFAGAGHF